MGDILRFENITKRYGKQTVLDNVSLSIGAGEIFSLLGPSGCGKTTLLRICGGFEAPDSGRVILDGKDITDLPPNKREIRTVFQNYALFPHMTVWDNIAFGLKIAKVDKRKINDEVQKYLELVQLVGHERKKPGQLSGGQRQRVGIAMAMAMKPKLLLADEPTSALDVTNQAIIVKEMMNVRDKMNTAIIIVTHNMGVSCYMADYIMVMKKGRVVEYGKAEDVIYHPKEEYTRMLLAAVPKMGGKDA